MVSYSNFYEGASYGFEPNYGEFIKTEYRTPAGSISVAGDARTANQIKTVTEKLNTGARAVEVQMTMPEIAESIPNQHLEELNRLRKLTGSEFTLHGPLVEPTGVTKQGWDDTQRQQAERQMWSALQRGHKLDPNGNIVVTFHSSNGLPEPESWTINEKTGEEELKGVFTVDERNGQFAPINPNAFRENYLLNEKMDPKKAVDAIIDKTNNENWTKQLSQASFHAHSGGSSIKNIMELTKDKENLPEDVKSMDFAELYKMSKTTEGQKFINDLSPNTKTFVDKTLHEMNYGEIYVKEAYNDLQELYNQAWASAEREKRFEDKKKLERYGEELRKKVKDFSDTSKLPELADEVLNGINVLNAIKTPKIVRPLKDFAIDQASETFSNLAVSSYKEFADSSPVISIENPPAGSGLSRAEDLKELIEKSREKFVDKMKKEGLTEEQAKSKASMLIGATWDIGHINMLRKYGYDTEKLAQQTKTIGKYVKNVHLSDNFGMEHTELPMGMGNVPTDRHMDILDKYNKQLKKVIEAGNWYQHFQTTPFSETLAAFGSPIYSMTMSPYWNQAAGRLTGGYFAGYGLNPDVHHAIYGAGFSGLPTELGGQIGGGRSRLSGTSME